MAMGELKLKGYLEKPPRIAYELTYGPIPAGMNACHVCDNPICCRPDHLFLGTQVDNIRDMHNKGRQSKPREGHWVGAKNASAKLTDVAVREIRTSDEGINALALRFGVSRATIKRVRQRKTWAEIQ